VLAVTSTSPAHAAVRLRGSPQNVGMCALRNKRNSIITSEVDLSTPEGILPVKAAPDRTRARLYHPNSDDRPAVGATPAFDPLSRADCSAVCIRIPFSAKNLCEQDHGHQMVMYCNDVPPRLYPVRASSTPVFSAPVPRSSAATDEISETNTPGYKKKGTGVISTASEYCRQIKGKC
jgi:hypothetical protein